MTRYKGRFTFYSESAWKDWDNNENPRITGVPAGIRAGYLSSTSQ
jgi:hypothetical protein